MPVQQASDIADLLVATQDHLGPNKFEDLASNFEWYLADTFMRKENRRYQGGTKGRFNAITSTSGAAKMTGIGATDDVDVRPNLTNGEVEWRHSTVNYAIDEIEVMMNASEPHRIVELVATRRAGAMIDLAELMETQLWSSPADGSDNAFGIPYWVTDNASDGFNGGNPSGHSDKGGIDASSVSSWNNWTFTYSAFSVASLVRKMRTAQYRTNWRPPTEIPGYDRKGDRYCFVMVNTDTIVQMEEMLDAQNENLGADLATFGGKTQGFTRTGQGMVFFRGYPVIQVPKLRDSSLTDPIYMLDLNKFGTRILKNRFMKETVIPRASRQHTVTEFHVDTTFNWVCENVRHQAVGYRA